MCPAGKVPLGHVPNYLYVRRLRDTMNNLFEKTLDITVKKYPAVKGKLLPMVSLITEGELIAATIECDELRLCNDTKTISDWLNRISKMYKGKYTECVVFWEQLDGLRIDYHNKVAGYNLITKIPFSSNGGLDVDNIQGSDEDCESDNLANLEIISKL